MYPEERLTFSEIVHQLETYLAELVNYFDPSSPDQQEDPYVNWKLCKEIPMGMNEDDEPHVHLKPPEKENELVAEFEVRNEVRNE